MVDCSLQELQRLAGHEVEWNAWISSKLALATTRSPFGRNWARRFFEPFVDGSNSFPKYGTALGRARAHAGLGRGLRHFGAF